MGVTSEISIYVHIPFCEKKCVYCDFYSIENLSLREDFVALLEKEIELKLSKEPSLHGRTVNTLFLGGGTPSLLTPKELERIMIALQRHFVFSPEIEFTLECNPGTVDLEKLTAYRTLGVNRLSFGVQSFLEKELQFLGRIHSADEAREAVRLARKAGFDNINIDLIFSLPGQTIEELKYSLVEAIKLDTDHISAYNLIVEHGTPLFRMVQLNKVIELDQDHAADLYELVQNRLAEAGYVQYEISNYAKHGRKPALHNLAYWDGHRDYVSFGPSAHEFVEGVRSWNVSSLEQYRSMLAAGNLPRLNSERLTIDEQRTETLYLQLRSTGLRIAEFDERFGEDILDNEETLFYISEGHLIVEHDLLKLTKKGYRFCDGVVRGLIRERVAEEFVLF